MTDAAQDDHADKREVDLTRDARDVLRGADLRARKNVSERGAQHVRAHSGPAFVRRNRRGGTQGQQEVENRLKFIA